MQPHRNARLLRGALTLLALPLGGAARAFDYFEHRWIGDLACGLFADDDDACVLWRDAVGGVGTVSFGDLTALVGDHYGTPEELAEALEALSQAPRGGSACALPVGPALGKMCKVLRYRELELAYVRSWLANAGARSWSHDIEACTSLTPWLATSEPWLSLPRRSRQACRGDLADAALALDEVAPPRVAGDCFAPPDSLDARLRGLPDRITLAASDQSHFGSHALVQWRSFHAAAKAALARGATVSALANEAFAVHFLTDLFAGGHIRNPRARFGHRLADAMQYHDQDNTVGLLVEAPQGGSQRWYAYGDRCLFGAPARANRAMVVDSALGSLQDLFRPGRAPWRFVPPKLSAADATPLPVLGGLSPLKLSLYTGVGTLVSGDAAPPIGVELVVSEDWYLTTWWNPLLDFRHGVSLWGDGTLILELASAPIPELVTLPAVPFVALASSESADALRRFGKGIDGPTGLVLGPVTLQLDADLGLALVRRGPEGPLRPHALLRAGIFFEVPDRWRFFVPRVTALFRLGSSDEEERWLMSFTSGIEHTF